MTDDTFADALGLTEELQQDPEPHPELTLDKAKELLELKHQHVETCRRQFYRLAELRAAELVLHRNYSWDQGGEYINQEMTGLDQQLGAGQ